MKKQHSRAKTKYIHSNAENKVYLHKVTVQRELYRHFTFFVEKYNSAFCSPEISVFKVYYIIIQTFFKSQ